MKPTQTPEPKELLRAQLIAWAGEELGAQSSQGLAGFSLAPAEEMLAKGHDLADAALATVYPYLGGCELLRSEFFGYLWNEVSIQGAVRPYFVLSRFVETGDLLASTFGDMMEICTGLDFRGRLAFIAMIRQRIKWKTYRKVEQSARVRTVESVESESLAVDQPRQLDLLAAQESKTQVMEAVARLHAKDRHIISLFLAKKTGAEIAAELGVRPGAARKSLQRALERLRGFMSLVDDRS